MSPKPKNLLSTSVQDLLSKNQTGVSWGCFLALVLANALLSYFPLTLVGKIWTILLGLITPLFISFRVKKENNFLKKEAFPLPPPWAWVLLAMAALFLRLYRLTTLSTWPIMDEGMFGYFAVRLCERWNWELLHWVSQEPILYTWGLSSFFKLGGPSLFTLWLFPAVCSILCLPLAWTAFRKFLPSSGRFIFLALFALGFWPVYMGRFSVQSILFLLWELLTATLLFWYLDKTNRRPKIIKALVLGLAAGAGLYIYLAWPLVILAVGLALLADDSYSIPQRLQTALAFSFVVLILALPLLFAYAHEYRGYFNHLFTSGSGPWENRFPVAPGYLRDLFWGTPAGFFRYGPVWGGLLNPVSTSLFFWGLASLLKSFRVSRSFWLPSAALLFFLPALLTNNLEMMRLTPLLPVLVAVCAVGAQSFLLLFPPRRAFRILTILLLVSCGLDAHQLLGVYPRHWLENIPYYSAHKSPEFYGAYGLLKPLAVKEGPGLILLNFNPDPYDQTLFVATYTFNAAENPRLDPSSAKWAALLANIHEQPYLRKLFPEGQWTWLSEGRYRRDGGFLLEITPLTSANRDLWNRWAQADQSLKELNHMIMERDVDPDQASMLEVLTKAYPAFRGDPLLESRFWRIVALHHAAEAKVGAAADDEKTAIERGYPMAHLYNERGCLLFKENKLKESEEAFKKALGMKLNCTDAATNLQNLETIIRAKKP
jgi:hypothetical protein